MNIGIDIRVLGKKRTGDESVFFNLVKQMCALEKPNAEKKAIHTFTLFIDERSQEELRDVKRSLGIEHQSNVTVTMLPTRNAFIWNIWTLPQYLKSHPVDVYHTQYIVPLNLDRTISVVTHIHDVSFCVYPQYISLKDRLFLRLLIPRSLRRATKIIAVSEFTKAEIMRYYNTPEHKIEVVYNALAEDFMSTYEVKNGESLDERKLQVKDAYALPEKFVLYVGTLQPRKNVPALIRAFSLLRQSAPDIKLVVVGKRDGYHYDAEIDRAIQENSIQEAVIFPGYIDQKDLPVLMSLAKVFAFPSLYEGFGIPLLEAMSEHVPVLASDIPVHHEIAGNAAEYVDTRDLVKFSKVLYTILINDTLRAQLVAAGSVKLRHYDWRASARHMLSIYVDTSSETIFRHEK